MKKNVLSLTLVAGMVSAVYAVEPTKPTAPSVSAPQVSAPAVAAPSVKAPDANKKEGTYAAPVAGAGAAAPEGKAEQLKISDIDKVTNGHYNQSHVDALVKNFTARAPQGQRTLSPEIKEMIRSNLISQALVVQEAKRQGLGKRPEIKSQIDLVGDNVLVGAFLADYFKKNPVSDADAKKEYDVLVAQNSTQKEYQARHILVEKEEEAKQLIERIKKGEAFDKLAKENSKDEGSKVNGGDLGWAIPQETYVKPFADAVTTLEKGKFTMTPVKSKFGYHIIQLIDVRTAKAPEFEQVKAGLIEKLKGKKLEQLINGLRAKTAK